MTEITPWPNQEEILDGVVPVEEVSQDPDLFDDDDADEIDLEMED
jgi:hypothetical protein